MKKSSKVLKRLEKDDILPGMKIRLENDVEKEEYTVLDVGVPFILVENLTTHFAGLYRVIECVFIEDKNKE